MFSFLADDHEVNARILSGSYDDVAKTVALSGCNGDARPRCEAAGGRDSVQTNMAGPQVPDAGAHPTITFHSATIDTPTRTVGRSPALTRFAGANELLGRAHFSLVASMNPAYFQRSRSPVEQRSARRPRVRRSEPGRYRSNSFERIIAKRFATTG